MDDFPRALSRLEIAPQASPEKSLAMNCNEMFRTWPPLVLGWYRFAALMSQAGHRWPDHAKSGNGVYIRG